MTSKVAVVRFDSEKGISLKQALDSIGGIDDINIGNRPVVIKVGVFRPTEDSHSSVAVVDSIIRSFDKAPKVFITESDNYHGTGSERLQIWKELFGGRVVPFNLSEDTDTRKFKAADEQIPLSHVLLKPNVLVSTHILRVYENGSVLKNLLGLVPDRKKVRFHKKLAPALADMYEAVGGIDLAVMDGTYFRGGSYLPVRMNTLLVGRDAVAVETVGGVLAGLDPQKMPILREFVKRGLGEGDLKNIEIIGASFESLKEEFAAAKTHRKRLPRGEGPTTWGGRVHHAFKSLVDEGFFNLQKKRTFEEIVKALESKGLPTKGKERNITDVLARRVKRKILKTEKGKNGRVYWAE